MNSLTKCGEHLFENMSIITFNAKSLEVVPAYCFTRCNALVTVDIPACTTIGDYAFQETTSIATLVLRNLTHIGNRAFKDSMRINLHEIGILQHVGDHAFENLYELKFAYQEGVGSFSSFYLEEKALSLPFDESTFVSTGRGNRDKSNVLDIDICFSTTRQKKHMITSGRAFP